MRTGPQTDLQTGPMLRLVLGMGHLLQPLAAPLLRRRLNKGKEDPARWREKLGDASVPRPDGPLVWLHGVGVGEVMALTGLIDALATARPDLHFLVTSSARTSAEVFARNAPPRCIHQFLPLDLPRPVDRFLDHWRPDLGVWSDQDLWPRLILRSARAGVPQVWLNARMDAASHRSRARFGPAYGQLYTRFAAIQAQDQTSADHISALSPDAPVTTTASFKAAALPLADAPAERAALNTALAGRKIWLAASTHAEDEAVALNAQAQLFARDPAHLLIVAPRDAHRGGAVAKAPRRSEGARPGPDDPVWIADTMGELGLWYRMARAALVGGSFGPVQGHNPWEAVALSCPVLHGPNLANFARDYALLDQADAAAKVTDAAALAALIDRDLTPMATRAKAVRDAARDGLMAARDTCLALLEPRL